jgi:hypothetical protein
LNPELRTAQFRKNIGGGLEPPFFNPALIQFPQDDDSILAGEAVIDVSEFLQFIGIRLVEPTTRRESQYFIQPFS